MSASVADSDMAVAFRRGNGFAARAIAPIVATAGYALQSRLVDQMAQRVPGAERPKQAERGPEQLAQAARGEPDEDRDDDQRQDFLERLALRGRKVEARQLHIGQVHDVSFRTIDGAEGSSRR